MIRHYTDVGGREVTKLISHDRTIVSTWDKDCGYLIKRCTRTNTCVVIEYFISGQISPYNVKIIDNKIKNNIT